MEVYTFFYTLYEWNGTNYVWVKCDKILNINTP